MNGIKSIFKLFVGIMIAFSLQKIYFLWMTWHDSTAYSDVLDVIYHGLKLDLAVAGYVLVVPWLLHLINLFANSNVITRILKGYHIVISFVLAIIIVSDASLYPFWQFKLDASIFLYTDKPKDAMASVSVWYIVQRLFWILVWAWTIWCIPVWLGSFRNLVQKGKKLITMPLYLVIGAVLFLIIRGGIGKGTNNVSDAYYSDNQYLNHATVNPVFNFIYSLGKMEDFGSEFLFFEEKEREKWMKGIYNTESIDTESLLNTDKPDILLIVWEGCCECMAKCIGGKTDITPNLSEIANEGILFSNCISNSYRTDRGLVCLTAGWLGLPNASLMKMPQSSEKLPALPRVLLNNGYATKFWYGGDISFTNMGGYMRQAGFSKIVSDVDFTRKERTTDWGVPDDIVFEKIAKDIVKAESPSFDAVMTLSSHEPWDVPIHELDDERENAFRYTDICIGKLIKELKKSPRWENMLVIITADHGATDATKPRYDRGIIHIPMVWCGGAVKQAKTIDKMMNQSDLAATLLGQMGIEHDDFIFSRDIMSTSYIYPTATFCYNNGVMFADSTGFTIYDNDAGRTIVGKDRLRENKAKATLQTVYKEIGSN